MANSKLTRVLVDGFCSIIARDLFSRSLLYTPFFLSSLNRPAMFSTWSISSVDSSAKVNRFFEFRDHHTFRVESTFGILIQRIGMK